MSFWESKPLNVSNTNIKSNCENFILDKDILKYKINNEIENSKFKLDYQIIDLNDEKSQFEILEFINNNYVSSKEYSLKYNIDLLKYWIGQKCLILKFIPKNTDDIIGVIMGKKVDIYNKSKNEIIPTLDVNFLCIKSNLRNIGLSSLIINILTKECLEKYDDILSSLYSIAKEIKAPNFCKISLCNIPINSNKFINNQDEYINKLDKEYNEKTHGIKYINTEYIKNQISENEIKYLFEKLNKYNNKEYDIYKIISYKEFFDMFNNKNFHHIIIKNKSTKEITDYVCYFELKSKYLKNNTFINNGYYYCGFYKNNDLKYIDNIYKLIINKLKTKLDILIIPNSQKIYNSSTFKISKNTGFLNFYYYNLNIETVNPDKFGFFTI